MSAVTVVAQIPVAACFVTAGVAKLRSGGVDPLAARALGVPARLAGGLRWTLPTVELVTGALMAWPPAARLGAVPAAVLLAAFTVLTAGARLRGRQAVCACFGASSRRPVDGWTVGRNLLLLALTLAVMLGDPPALSGAGQVLVAAVVIIVAQTWLLAEAWRTRPPPRAASDALPLTTMDG
jgi:Methylamine utilisation protein MauE